jgi:AcrR family transcriptional regulator
MGRPREHDDRTRQRILSEAADLLRTDGPHAVTVRGVAERADTTTRAIYSLFAGKEGLFRALYHDAAAVMTRYHEEVPPADDPVEEFLELADAYRRAAMERPHAYELLMNGVPGFEPAREDRRLLTRSFTRVIESFERMAKADQLGGREPRAVASQMWGLVHGLTSLELRGHLGDAEQADARWRDAISSAISGYRQQPLTGSRLEQ